MIHHIGLNVQTREQRRVRLHLAWERETEVVHRVDDDLHALNSVGENDLAVGVALLVGVRAVAE